jgi:hypothetical protein
MYVLYVLSGTCTDAKGPGHRHLWMAGIHHGDISPRNLMYDFPAGAQDPVGILNDFDLATLVGKCGDNSDRTGTIPFMAIDMLNGGLKDRIPRLYRHDLESFSWVLTYITVARIEYKDCTIKISPLGDVEAWFRNDQHKDREAHILSKKSFHDNYGQCPRVSGRYYPYRTVVRGIIKFWHNIHVPQVREEDEGDLLPYPEIREAPALNDPVGDEGWLELFVVGVERLLEEGDRTTGFAAVKNILEATVGNADVL